MAVPSGPAGIAVAPLLRDGPLTGLVEVHPIANRRVYMLRPKPFNELDAWLDSFRCVMEERYDRFDAYLQALHRKKDGDES